MTLSCLQVLQDKELCLSLQCVFHGIRLLRLIKIDCRETINFFMPVLHHHPFLFLTKPTVNPQSVMMPLIYPFTMGDMAPCHLLFTCRHLLFRPFSA